MIGDTFKNLKNHYTEIIVSESEIEQKWQMLEGLLPEQELPRTSYHFTSYSAVFLGAVLVLCFITIGFAQTAKPGTLLYPINSITQEVAKKITNTLKPESPTMTMPNVSSPAGVMKKSPTPTTKPTVTPSSYPKERENSPSVFEKAHSKMAPTIQVLGSQTKDTDQAPLQAQSHGNTVNASNNSQKDTNAANNSQSQNSHMNNNKSSNSSHSEKN